MNMATHKLLWNILSSNRKSGASGASETLVLLQNVKSTYRGVLYLVKFQAASLHLYYNWHSTPLLKLTLHSSSFLNFQYTKLFLRMAALEV